MLRFTSNWMWNLFLKAAQNGLIAEIISKDASLRFFVWVYLNISSLNNLSASVATSFCSHNKTLSLFMDEQFLHDMICPIIDDHRWTYCTRWISSCRDRGICDNLCIGKECDTKPCRRPCKSHQLSPGDAVQIRRSCTWEAGNFAKATLTGSSGSIYKLLDPISYVYLHLLYHLYVYLLLLFHLQPTTNMQYESITCS